MSVKRNLLSRLTRTRLLFPLLLIVLLLPAVYFYATRPKETAAWWNESWVYRKRIDISNPGGSNLTDFQVSFNLDTASLITAGKLQSNCQDIRVTDHQGKVLPYWIEGGSPGCNDSVTEVWTKVPTLPASNGYIYVYYGNPSASDNQNPQQTFQFFDSFSTIDTTKWQDTTGTNSLVSEGYDSTALYTTQDDNDIRFFSSSTFSGGYAVKARMKENGSDGGLFFDVQNNANGYLITSRRGGSTTAFQWYKRTTGSWAAISSHNSIGSWTSTEFRTLEISRVGTSITVKDNETSITYTTSTDATYSSGSIGIRASGGSAQTIDWIFVRKAASTQPTTATQSEEIGPGPIAYWKFDEGTGTTANDSSSSQKNGSLSGSPEWRSETECVSGKCLFFDGTNVDVVNITDSGSTDPLDLGTKSFTVSFWGKPLDYTYPKAVFPLLDGNAPYTDGAGHEGWSISDNYTASGVNISFNDGTNRVTSTLSFNSGSQPPDLLNNWTHFVYVFNRTTNQVTAYINGTLQNSNVDISSVTGSISNTSNFKIGYGTGWKTHGFIDEFKIYPYARTADQVLQDYNQYANSIGGGSSSLSNGLVGYWKMDEASWTNDCSTSSATDSSGKENHGKSCPASTGPTGGSTGKYSHAGNFDGTDDYISLTTAYLPNQDNFTIAAWFLLDSSKASTNESFPILGNNQATPFLGYNPSVKAFSQLRQHSTGSETINWGATSLANLADNSWHHVTLSVNQTSFTASLYVDGSLLSTQNIGTEGYTHSNGNFRAIGKDWSAYWMGKIDEVRLYQRALSASEVSSLYHFAPGPIGYWKMDEKTGTTTNDSSGNGNTGTLTNSPTWVSGKYGSGIRLSTDNRHIDVPSFSPAISNSQMTVEGWINISFSGVQRLFHTPGTSTSFGFSGTNMYVHTSTTAGADTNTPYTTLPTSCQSGWHYLSVIWNTTAASDNVKVYCDGKLLTSANLINSLNGNFNISAIKLGYSASTQSINGSIDDFKIYNYARTAEQIRQDMTGTASPGVSSGSTLPQPITYWPFDEQTGQTAYDKYGSNNGTLGANSSLGSDDPTWKTTSNCKINGCLHFDGTDDFITIPTISQVDANQSYTVSLWFNQDSTSGIRTLFNNYASSTRNGILISGSSVGGGHYISSYNITSGTFSTNTWNHIAYVNDNGTVKNYLNGRLVTGGSLGNLGTNSRIGYTSPNGNYFNGYIDEIKVYNSALTEEQIKQDMNTGSTLAVGTTTSEAADLSDGAGNPPILEWKLDEKTGTTANDTSGNNNTGSATNTTWKSTKDCKQGACLSFTSSSSSYVTTSTDPGTMASGTYSLWVKPSTLSANMGWIDSTFDIFQWTGNILYFRAGNQSSVSISNWNPNTWYHLALVWNGTNYYGYVNGKQVTSGTQSGSRTGQISIGRVDGGYYFTGLIDHVKIYNYARTPAQIAYDYNRGDPIAHWKMDECQGSTIHDSSDNSNHGTLTVTTTGGNTNGIGTCTTSTSAWGAGASGKFGASLNFDGDGDYIDLASDLGYTNQVSAFAWFKSLGSPAGGYHIIFGGQELEISIPASTGEIRTGVFTSARYVSNHGSGLTDGNWHHIGFTFDGSTKKSYIDGVYVGQQTGIPGTLTSTFSNRRIGRYGSSATYYANGLIDDARIYNYALSEAQVKKIMNEGSALRFGD